MSTPFHVLAGAGLAHITAKVFGVEDHAQLVCWFLLQILVQNGPDIDFAFQTLFKLLWRKTQLRFFALPIWFFRHRYGTHTLFAIPVFGIVSYAAAYLSCLLGALPETVISQPIPFLALTTLSILVHNMGDMMDGSIGCALYFPFDPRLYRILIDPCEDAGFGDAISIDPERRSIFWNRVRIELLGLMPFAVLAYLM